MNFLYVGMGILIIAVVLLAIFFIKRLVVVPPSDAVIVSGSGTKKAGAKVVPSGGRVFVIPFLQKYTVIDLSQISLALSVKGVDKNNIPLEVSANANLKVGSTPEMIRAAGERFSSAKNFEQAIREKVVPILLGSLRSILSEMTISELLTNRNVLAKKVLDGAQPHLAKMGLDLDSLTVDNISDPNGYIDALSVPETEAVKKRARIATAEADKEANDAEVAAQIEIVTKRQEFDIREAELKSKRDKEIAKADAAKPIADAAEFAKIAEANEKVATEESLLRAKQLEIEVNRPAEAALYETQRRAEAEKAKRVAEAEAEAEAIRLKGQAKAEAIRLEGEAEAEAMEKKAEAWSKYDKAALNQQILDKLPEIARAYAEPLGKIEGMTVVSTEGASPITSTIANGFAQVDALVKSYTGTSIKDNIGGMKEEKIQIEEG